jgi:hypothetical protein
MRESRSITSPLKPKSLNSLRGNRESGAAAALGACPALAGSAEPAPVILSIDSLSAAHDGQKLRSSLAVVPEACEAGEDVDRQAMTDAELVPSCPFLSVVPVF